MYILQTITGIVVERLKREAHMPSLDTKSPPYSCSKKFVYKMCKESVRLGDVR